MPVTRGSWYSQFPQAGWVDYEDRPGSNALGVPDEMQGIALPSRRTLGQWFNVTAPGGQTLRLQQTDVGPAARTGRGIDISAAAAHKFGYTPNTFPTDAAFSYAPVDAPAEGTQAINAALRPTGQRAMPTSLSDLAHYAPEQPRSLFGRVTGFEPSNAMLGYLAGALQGGNLGQSISRGIQGSFAGSQEDFRNQQRAAAQQYGAGLTGVDPNLQRLLVSDPEMAQKYAVTNAITPQLTEDIKNYNFAVQKGYGGSFTDYQKELQTYKEHFGVTPTYIWDPDKQTYVIGQMSSRGGYRPSQLPPGTQAAPGVKFLDVGTGFAGYGPGGFTAPGAPGVQAPSAMQPIEGATPGAPGAAPAPAAPQI